MNSPSRMKEGIPESPPSLSADCCQFPKVRAGVSDRSPHDQLGGWRNGWGLPSLKSLIDVSVQGEEGLCSVEDSRQGERGR